MANDFTQQRVVNLVMQLDQTIDESTKVHLMENCGRMCARSGAISLAQQANGDVAAFLTSLRNLLGDKNVSEHEHAITVIYPQCFCEMARDIENLPATYCYCSQGWLKEMFETVAARPVAVRIEETIKRGGQVCRFTVTM